MKSTVLMLVSIASVAGVASMANATPFTAQSQGLGNLVRDGGFDVSDVARGLGSTLSQGPGFSTSTLGFTPGENSGNFGGSNPLTLTSTPVSGVPEGGKSLLFLGAGLFALAVVRRHWLRRSY